MPEPTTCSSIRWNTLGTYGFLAVGDPTLLDAAHRVALDVLDAVDRTCSRFRDDSDLVRANTRPGAWVDVDPLLVAAVDVAVEAARATDGLVDPCLGRSMVWLGYDADLAVVRERATPTRRTPPPAPRPGAWRDVGTDPEGAIRVPADCALDLGATAKAWASDLVARSIVEQLGTHVILSLGGDIRIDGPVDAEHPGWPVAVTERPEDTDGAETVWLDGGGLATSSTIARRWGGAGGQQHHLLDPRTGLPTTEFWRTATATGPTCVAANTATTAALVLGAEAPAWLEHHSVTARLVGYDGAVTRVGGWPQPEHDHELTARTLTNDGRS
jgi:thiamine biosynthesis lipoprotein